MYRRRACPSRIRLSSLAGLLAAAQISTACLVLNLHPAYDDTAILFDESLVGTWDDPDGGSIMIEAGAWRSYKIAFTDRGETLTLTGHLTQIGTARFLDLRLAHALEQGALVVPAHLLYRIELAGGRLTASPLAYDWFRNAVGTAALARLQHALDEKQNVILTARPAALRTWIKAHAERPEVFGEPMTFVRKKGV